MLQDRQNLSERIKRTIINAVQKQGFHPQRIILFGSRARGDYSNQSDWDFLIVIKESLTPIERKNLWFAIYRELHQTFQGFFFDLKVKSLSAYETERIIPNTIAYEAETEGIVI